MSDMSDAQFAAFVDRIMACRDAEDSAKADTKVVYAEAAAANLDKTALGLVVRDLRMDGKQRNKAEVRSATVENYRERYERGKASHIRARVRHDADGVIIEDSIDDDGHRLRVTVDPRIAEILSRSEVAKPQPLAPASPAQTVGDHLAVDASEAEPEAVESSAANPEAKASTDSGATAQVDEPKQPADSVTGDASRASRAPGPGCNVDKADVTAGETAPLPQIPIDFHSDVPPDQLEARIRRTLKMRPNCAKPWSCGASSPGECFSCRKAANQGVAA